MAKRYTLWLEIEQTDTRNPDADPKQFQGLPDPIAYNLTLDQAQAIARILCTDKESDFARLDKSQLAGAFAVKYVKQPDGCCDDPAHIHGPDFAW